MQTPLLLQQFIAADRAPVRLSNLPFEFCGSLYAGRGDSHEARLDKSRLLRVVLPLMAARVLPYDGLPLKQREDLSLAELAPIAGYRHASSFARAMAAAPPLFSRERRRSSSTKYEWRFKASQRKRFKNEERAWKGWNQPSGRELAGDPVMGQHFKGLSEDEGGGGYFDSPGWIEDPKLPATPNERVTLRTAARLGVFSGNRTMKETQGLIASLTGFCKDTIRRHLRKFAIYHRRVMERDKDGRLRVKRNQDGCAVRIEERGDLPILRIANERARWEKNGLPLEKRESGAVLRQPPNLVVYIGDRMLDARTGLLETERLLKLAAAKGYTAELWWHHVARVHGMLLQQYIGTERYVGTLWAACRNGLQAAGLRVPQQALDDLFPEWRPPPD